MGRKKENHEVVCPVCNRLNEFFDSDIDDDITVTCWCCRRKIDVRGVAYGDNKTSGAQN